MIRVKYEYVTQVKISVHYRMQYMHYKHWKLLIGKYGKRK